MHFDVLIAKVSLILDALSQMLVVVVDPAKEVWFIVASYLTSFGGGVNPSLQSLALCLNQAQALSSHTEGEEPEEIAGAGEILGAVSFLTAIGAWILGVSDLFPLINYSDLLTTHS
jgi:hypothetical protein